MTATDPRDCPHGVQYCKRMQSCAACMEPEIERLEARVEELGSFLRNAQASQSRMFDELRNARVAVAALVRQLGGEARIASEVFAALDPDGVIESWTEPDTQELVLRCR
jgi:hypothetical protein